MSITIQMPTKYRLTLENYDGRCKRVTVLAHSPEDAMGMYYGQGGWHAVDAKAVV